ncbi:GH-E family nuclease [Aquimarina hainanensis]|uniref:GH-E family nuclease n=1 Tax=Aquimarina hainanensis TaxID=1578017 RepID=A0ABW5NA18_9FLAO
MAVCFYRRDWKLYKEGKLSWGEMKERYNDPNRYRPELPSTNRSHKLEEKDN